MNQNKFAPTTVNEYFAWLEQTVDHDTALYQAAHGYLEKERCAAEEPARDDPFLTVITRTQAKRPDMLTETLLSLTGQSNTNFELLVMGHNLTEDQQHIVEGLISDLPQWMREKTRLIPVVGGTRTTPLNAGFDAAKGRYIAVLDDDDLVFDHWVETFYEMSKKYDGKILHTYTVIQDWETVGGDFPNTPRAVGAPKNTYCCDFDLMSELTLNKCPLCALAFPAKAFKQLGIRFEESLTTTEDWDFLMRTAFITGVADNPEITFLYRNWLNAENSASLHQREEWIKNYKFIVDRFSKTPIVMPVGSLNKVYERILDQENNGIYTEGEDMTELFYNDGAGFSQEKTWCRKNSEEPSKMPYVYTAGKNGAKGICGIRFDPLQYGAFSLENLLIRVIDTDGESKDYTLGDVITNGYVLGETIVFLKNDPQIVLNFATPINVKEVQIGCKIHEHLADETVDAVIAALTSASLVTDPTKRSLLYRGARKIYRISKRVLRMK